MRVIDVSAGDRAMWVDREDADCVFVDVRHKVGPDVVADSRNLPFADGTFDLAVFDPPHCPRTALTGAMLERYGEFEPAYIRALIKDTARELARVTTPAGALAFKWNDRVWTLRSAVGWLSEYWRPLFGTITTRNTGSSQTSWVMMAKVTEDRPALALVAPGRWARRQAEIKAARGRFRSPAPGGL